MYIIIIVIIIVVVIIMSSHRSRETMEICCLCVGIQDLSEGPGTASAETVQALHPAMVVSAEATALFHSQHHQAFLADCSSFMRACVYC